jgi:hypothetical protein
MGGLQTKESILEAIKDFKVSDQDIAKAFSFPQSVESIDTKEENALWEVQKRKATVPDIEAYNQAVEGHNALVEESERSSASVVIEVPAYPKQDNFTKEIIQRTTTLKRDDAIEILNALQESGRIDVLLEVQKANPSVMKSMMQQDDVMQTVQSFVVKSSDPMELIKGLGVKDFKKEDAEVIITRIADPADCTKFIKDCVDPKDTKSVISGLSDELKPQVLKEFTPQELYKFDQFEALKARGQEGLDFLLTTKAKTKETDLAIKDLCKSGIMTSNIDLFTKNVTNYPGLKCQGIHDRLEKAANGMCSNATEGIEQDLHKLYGPGATNESRVEALDSFAKRAAKMKDHNILKTELLCVSRGDVAVVKEIDSAMKNIKDNRSIGEVVKDSIAKHLAGIAKSLGIDTREVREFKKISSSIRTSLEKRNIVAVRANPGSGQQKNGGLERC